MPRPTLAESLISTSHDRGGETVLAAYDDAVADALRELCDDWSRDGRDYLFVGHDSDGYLWAVELRWSMREPKAVA